MGPKGKSLKKNLHLKNITEAARLTHEVSVAETKIEQLSIKLETQDAYCVSLNNKLFQKQVEVASLAKMFFEMENLRSNFQKKLISISSEIENLKHQCFLKDKQKQALLDQENYSKPLKRKNPFSDDLPVRTKQRLFNDSYDACASIFGGSDTNKVSIAKGMFATVCRKFKCSEVSNIIFHSKSDTINNKLSKLFVSDWQKNFQKSDQNIFRSLSTYYSHTVLGKLKYRAIRKGNRYAKFKGRKVVNFVSYEDLSKHISSIDIGLIKPISDLIPLGELTDVPLGYYREIRTYVLRLAKFYITVNSSRLDKLLNFDQFSKKVPDSTLLLLAFGGDGAPGLGTVFNVSFLNIGRRIYSSSETFSVFGGDVDEGSTISKNFVIKAIKDFEFLESQVFELCVEGRSYKVEFKLTELPNDMKMLATLCGELTNSAKYFTTFADVNQDNVLNTTYTLGKGWNPYKYEKRLTDAKSVMIFKENLKDAKITETTKRNKITSYISNKLKSRQEFTPLVGKYVDVAKCEPLHLKNNICKELYVKVWKLFFAHLSLSKFKKFSDIPTDNLFFKFVELLKKTMKLNMLSKKIISWFNDTNRGVDRDFTYRFRGQESNALLKCFPELFLLIMPCIRSFDKSGSLISILSRYFHQFILFRKLVSYSVRLINFSLTDADIMIECGKKLYKLSCQDDHISPSMWVLCHAAPIHAKKCLSLYGLGLGVNSMEAREQKHQRLKKYAENTTYSNRWPMIFRHEYVQLVYLRENGYDEIKYTRQEKQYLPSFDESVCQLCGLKLASQNCPLCMILNIN